MIRRIRTLGISSCYPQGHLVTLCEYIEVPFSCLGRAQYDSQSRDVVSGNVYPSTQANLEERRSSQRLTSVIRPMFGRLREIHLVRLNHRKKRQIRSRRRSESLLGELHRDEIYSSVLLDNSPEDQPCSS